MLDEKISFAERLLKKSIDDPTTAFVTSSFQTHSIPLLHLVSRIFNHKAPRVVLTDTSFLFADTKVFAAEVCDSLNLELEVIKSPYDYASQRSSCGRFLFAKNTDMCCAQNKTQPLLDYLKTKSIWINGARRDQTAFRTTLNYKEQTTDKCIRIHPILAWTSKDIFLYRKKYSLPENPLDREGYRSVGCQPCTAKYDPHRDERAARWSGLIKDECGLINDTIARG